MGGQIVTSKSALESHVTVECTSSTSHETASERRGKVRNARGKPTNPTWRPSVWARPLHVRSMSLPPTNSHPLVRGYGFVVDVVHFVGDRIHESLVPQQLLVLLLLPQYAHDNNTASKIALTDSRKQRYTQFSKT